MLRQCDSCSRDYQAKTQRSKFCSDTCRKRGERAPKSGAPKVQMGDTERTTVANLTEHDRLDTPHGQAAVQVARRIDSPHETGAAIASLVKQFSVALDLALEGVNAANDPLDELRDRRARRLG